MKRRPGRFELNRHLRIANERVDALRRRQRRKPRAQLVWRAVRYALRAWPRSVTATVVSVPLTGLLIAAALRFIAEVAVSVAVIVAVGWVLTVSGLLTAAAVLAYQALGFLAALDKFGRSGSHPRAHAPGNLPFQQPRAVASPRPQEPPEDESEVWE
ncbi:hypothetical protein ACFV3E_41425 [Streptomyces sp. NPDC059718]